MILAAALAVVPAMIAGPAGETAWGNARAQAEHSMRAAVIGGAGAPGTSANFRMNGTLGQSTPIGIGAAASKKVYAGFWGRPWALTGVDETPVVYRDALFQNYPNPFNPSTTIGFFLPVRERISVKIYDMLGKEVRTLIDNQEYPAGSSRVSWDGHDGAGQPASSGTYFYSLIYGNFKQTEKMTLLK